MPVATPTVPSVASISTTTLPSEPMPQLVRRGRYSGQCDMGLEISVSLIQCPSARRW